MSALAFSRDGSVLAAGRTDGSLVLLAPGSPSDALVEEVPHAVSSLALGMWNFGIGNGAFIVKSWTCQTLSNTSGRGAVICWGTLIRRTSPTRISGRISSRNLC